MRKRPKAKHAFAFSSRLLLPSNFSPGEKEKLLSLLFFKALNHAGGKQEEKEKEGPFALYRKKKPSRQGGVLNEKKEEKTPSLFLHVLLQTFGSFLFSFLPRRNSAYSHWAGNEIAAKEEDRTPAVFIAVKKKAETTAWKSEKKILFKDKTLFVWVVWKKPYRGWLYRMPAPSVTRGLHQSLGTCVEERERERKREGERCLLTHASTFSLFGSIRRRGERAHALLIACLRELFSSFPCGQASPLLLYYSCRLCI